MGRSSRTTVPNGSRSCSLCRDNRVEEPPFVKIRIGRSDHAGCRSSARPSSAVSRLETLAVFIFAALNQAFASLMNLPGVVFFAKSMFRESARRAISSGLVTTLLSVGLLLIYPHPVSILAGMALGGAYSFSAACWRCYKFAGEPLPKPKLE